MRDVKLKKDLYIPSKLLLGVEQYNTIQSLQSCSCLFFICNHCRKFLCNCPYSVCNFPNFRAIYSRNGQYGFLSRHFIYSADKFTPLQQPEWPPALSACRVLYIFVWLLKRFSARSMLLKKLLKKTVWPLPMKLSISFTTTLNVTFFLVYLLLSLHYYVENKAIRYTQFIQLYSTLLTYLLYFNTLSE